MTSGPSLTRINLLSQTARRTSRIAANRQKPRQICVTARQLTRAMDEIVWAWTRSMTRSTAWRATLAN